MEINCMFVDGFIWASFYTCKIISVSIMRPNLEIKNFIGEHQAGKTDDDVQAVWFNHTEVHYMPRGIHKIFPNLKAIYVFNCGLKELNRDDLFEFENITTLNFYFNEVTSLQDDLFVGMDKLKVIRFGNNKLEFVSSQLLQPVLENQLRFVDFRNNPTIDVAFDASKENPTGMFVDLPVLMKLINMKCKKPPNDEYHKKPTNLKSLKGLEKFWNSKHLSDFRIIVGQQSFPVHRIVLTMQSEYFEEVFNENPKEFQMNIDIFSAEVVEEVLRWIYTGQIPEVRNAMEVFDLVVKLKISGLKEISENLVLAKLNQNNAMEVFKLGDKCKSEKIMDLAFREIKKFLKLDQDNAMEVFEFGHKSNLEKIKKLAYEEIIKFINDPGLRPNFFENPTALRNIFEIKKKIGAAVNKKKPNLQKPHEIP